LHDELIPVFPELVSQLPDHADLGTLAVLRLLTVYSSAQALAQAPFDDVARLLAEVSQHRWGPAQAQALHTLARASAASARAVAAAPCCGWSPTRPRPGGPRSPSARTCPACARRSASPAGGLPRRGRCTRGPGPRPPAPGGWRPAAWWCARWPCTCSTCTHGW